MHPMFRRDVQSYQRSVIMCPMFTWYLQSFPRSVSMHSMFSRYLQSSHRSVSKLRLQGMLSRYLQSFPRSVSMRPMFSRQVLCGGGAYCAQRRLSERVVLERGRERCDVHCLSRGDVQSFPRSVSMYTV